MGSRIGGHLRAHIVGYIALVLAMSGTAYAVGANSVGDRELAKNSVGSSEIEPESVKSGDIESGSVGAEHLASPYADGCGYLGQIMQVGFNYAPEGSYLANGALLPIQSHQALFSLLGTTYGGNGTTNFALPNIKSNDGTTYIVCNSGIYPTRP